MAQRHITTRAGLVMALAAMILLTGCAGARINGAGCDAYQEARKDLPFDALAETPTPVVAWIDATDAGMFSACGA